MRWESHYSKHYLIVWTPIWNQIKLVILRIWHSKSIVFLGHKVSLLLYLFSGNTICSGPPRYLRCSHYCYPIFINYQSENYFSIRQDMFETTWHLALSEYWRGLSGRCKRMSHDATDRIHSATAGERDGLNGSIAEIKNHIQLIDCWLGKLTSHRWHQLVWILSCLVWIVGGLQAPGNQRHRVTSSLAGSSSPQLVVPIDLDISSCSEFLLLFSCPC